MITTKLWKSYIEICIFYVNFENDYFRLALYIFLTPFAIVVDILTMPIQLIGLVTRKIIEKRFYRKNIKNNSNYYSVVD